MRDQGLITHLAILHTDIEVEEHWLDKLLFLMKINKADIVGTVLPIKGEKNMTSTALWDGPFKVKRLTFDDCKKYGESFTDPALCVNTGAMLIDLRGKWIEGMCFTIEDRIRAEQGKYIAEVIPEDWGFSHRAAERGAKIVATTVVQAVHHGAGQWTNFEKGKKPIPLQTA